MTSSLFQKSSSRDRIFGKGKSVKIREKKVKRKQSLSLTHCAVVSNTHISHDKFSTVFRSFIYRFKKFHFNIINYSRDYYTLRGSSQFKPSTVVYSLCWILHNTSSLDCNVWCSFCLFSYSRLCHTAIAFSFYDVIIVPKKFQSRQNIRERQKR